MNSVNTNFGSLVAMKNMEKVEKTMQEAMERLSSGLRINHAADDAAGSAIASKMESSVRSLGQAIRNSQDAISMTQTAEGALGEIFSSNSIGRGKILLFFNFAAISLFLTSVLPSI